MKFLREVLFYSIKYETWKSPKWRTAFKLDLQPKSCLTCNLKVVQTQNKNQKMPAHLQNEGHV